MKCETDELLANNQLSHKLGVTLSGFSPKANVPYLDMREAGIAGTVRLLNSVGRLKEEEDDIEEAGNFIGYYIKGYEQLKMSSIASALSARSKISTAYRILVGYSLPPKVSQLEATGVKESVTLGIDLPHFSKNQLITYTNHLPLFKNLKELYLDKALSASSIKKYKKRESTAYLWEHLGLAVSQLVHLEVLSLRENEIHKYSNEDFEGLLALLAQAKSVVYVDISRNSLFALKGNRFERLINTLKDMPSLLSVNVTEYEPVKKYKKMQSQFDKLVAVLALRQTFFKQTGYASEQAQKAQQQSLQDQQELAALEVDPKYLKQSLPDEVLGLKWGHRRAVTLPTFIPVNDYANYQGVHIRAIDALTKAVRDKAPLNERDRTIGLNGSFVWLANVDTDLLEPFLIDQLFKGLQEISSLKRLLFGFTLPPKANRMKVLGREEWMGMDFTMLNKPFFEAIGKQIVRLRGLRELYFDGALHANALKNNRFDMKNRRYNMWGPLTINFNKLENLEVLSLRENQICDYADTDFSGLLRMLSQSDSVVYVDLSRNQLYKMTEQRFEQLVAALEKMPSLQSVNITEYESAEHYAHLQPLFDRLRRRLEAQGEFYRRTQCTSTFQHKELEAKKLDKSGESLRSVYVNVRQFFADNIPRTNHAGRLGADYARLLKRTQEQLNTALDSPRTSFRLLSIAAKLVPSLMNNTQVMQGMSTLYRHLMAERMQVVKDVRAVKSQGGELSFDLRYRVARYEGLFRQDDAASSILMELIDMCSVQHVEWRRTLRDELLAIGIMADGEQKTLLGEQAMLKQIEAQRPGDARLCSASELSALLQSLARVTQYTIEELLEADARKPQRSVLNANSSIGLMTKPQIQEPQNSTSAQQQTRPLPANPNPRAQALAMLKQREQSGLHQKAQGQVAYGQPKTQKPPSPEGGSPDNGSPEKNTYLSTM